MDQTHCHHRRHRLCRCAMPSAELLSRGHRLRALVRDPQRARPACGRRGGAGRSLRRRSARSACCVAPMRCCILPAPSRHSTEHDYFRVNAHGTLALAEAALRPWREALRAYLVALPRASRSCRPMAPASGRGKTRCSSSSAASQRRDHPPACRLWPGRPRHAAADPRTDTARRRHSGPARQSRFSLIHAADLARFAADALVNPADRACTR